MRYETLILTPINEMMGQVTGFIPTLLTTLGILIIGTLIAVFVTRLFSELFKMIALDKLTDTLRISHILKNGGKHKLSDVLTHTIGWILMVTVLIMTVRAYGLTGIDLFGGVLAYIPNVVSGALVLVIGLLLARIVSGLVHFAAATTGMPRPELAARLSKYAIVIYVTIAYLKEIGFVSLFGEHYPTLMTGIIFAISLAFGLAGKDLVVRFLDSLKEK